jgi:predicted nucleic acid-binding protein
VNVLVVDASVVAAAFFREPITKASKSVLTSGRELHAPELILSEVTNVVWKRLSRGDISQEEAEELAHDLLSLPISCKSTRTLVEPALSLSTQTGRTVYDCLYLALAIEMECPLITGDKRFFNSLKNRPLGDSVTWIETFVSPG